MDGSMAAGAETQTIRQAAAQMLRTVRSRSWCDPARVCHRRHTSERLPDSTRLLLSAPLSLLFAHRKECCRILVITLSGAAQVLREGLRLHGRRVRRLGVRDREDARAARHIQLCVCRLRHWRRIGRPCWAGGDVRWMRDLRSVLGAHRQGDGVARLNAAYCLDAPWLGQMNEPSSEPHFVHKA